MEERYLREIYLGGLFAALALTLPFGFHMVGLGAMFQPMLLPIFYLGFLTRLRVVLSVAIIAPALSCLLTGMPPLYPPVILVVMIEGIFLGGSASLLTHYLKTNFWISLFASEAIGKLAAVIITMIISKAFNLPQMVAGFALIIYTIPAIILQLTVIPATYKILKGKLRRAYEQA